MEPFLAIIPEMVNLFKLRVDIDRFDLVKAGISADEMNTLM